jgi:nucleoside-diphosphate-sugar epimerase
MEDITGKKAKVKRLERQKGDVTHTYADTTRAGTDLGFHPSIPLDEGLLQEAEWIEKNILS